MHWSLITLGLTVLLIGGLLYAVFQLVKGIAHNYYFQKQLTRRN